MWHDEGMKSIVKDSADLLHVISADKLAFCTFCNHRPIALAGILSAIDLEKFWFKVNNCKFVVICIDYYNM